METLQNFIGGRFIPPQSGNYMEVAEPATGQVYGRLAVSEADEVEQAVSAAQASCRDWSQMPVEKRSQWLMRIADLIEDQSAPLAEAESKDTGKPLSLARKLDIPRAVANFRFFAGAIMHWESQAHHSDSAINYTNRHPLGVVGCISPWNLPLYLLSWKIAPALATGNSVVAKPSEITPLTAWLLSAIFEKAGMPPGVVNIVHGPGAPTGESLVKNPGISAISFTGGTVTGRKIAIAAAPDFKKLSLEMGGKNPNIIFDDCDFGLALETTMRSSFSNQGQICLCGSRIFIQRGIYHRFRDALVDRTRNLKPTDPSDPECNLGALVSRQHLEKVLSYVELAKSEGGNLLTGGSRIELEGRCAGGYFMEPTIFEGLGADCRTNQEEIFGPVVTLIPFRDEEEALMMANDSPYGLSATLWTNNLNRAHRVAASLKAGVVWVNCWLLRDLRTPFGGMKQSGVGREGGQEALRFFTEAQNVCIRI